MGKIAKNRVAAMASQGLIPNTPEEILRADDVADMLGVTLQVLRRYNIPRHMVGRNCLYFKSDIHHFVRQCEQRGVNHLETGW